MALNPPLIYKTTKSPIWWGLVPYWFRGGVYINKRVFSFDPTPHTPHPSFGQKEAFSKGGAFPAPLKIQKINLRSLCIYPNILGVKGDVLM
ncbi:hypothetical protein [Nostoc sp. WHI]|uniref:hypothetical protein n=1 Tax=Nostoc sp. WHI TaxID=2650611 RepID=UPI0018C4EBFC|nr:hypothetical protein [Nostoc sp. WHI]MBG1268008.1 hypothetical protein [Nostoc sp. WHI]